VAAVNWRAIASPGFLGPAWSAEVEFNRARGGRLAHHCFARVPRPGLVGNGEIRPRWWWSTGVLSLHPVPSARHGRWRWNSTLLMMVDWRAIASAGFLGLAWSVEVEFDRADDGQEAGASGREALGRPEAFCRWRAGGLAGWRAGGLAGLRAGQPTGGRGEIRPGISTGSLGPWVREREWCGGIQLAESSPLRVRVAAHRRLNFTSTDHAES
jgi:hypothetical protein